VRRSSTSDAHRARGPAADARGAPSSGPAA
jgi:hypothetical protein